MSGLRSGQVTRHRTKSAPTPTRASHPGQTAFPVSAKPGREGGTATAARSMETYELRDLDGAWTVGGAVRFEHFDLFGATTNGKLSGRYRFAPSIALRGSVSSGFRAPTVGQQYAQNVQTTLDSNGNLVDRGTIQSNSTVAMLKGGQALKPETSVNYTIVHDHRYRDVHKSPPTTSTSTSPTASR